MRTESTLPETSVTVLRRHRPAILLMALVVSLFGVPAVNAQTCSTDADCDDLNACTNDRCVGLVGFKSCFHESLCDDGNVCNGTELCCTNPLGCAGGTPVGSCIPGTPVSCAPGQFCIEVGLGECVECNSDPSVGPTIGCNDGNVCTADACVSGACQNAPVLGACDDGNACTTMDACAGGTCVGVPVDCRQRVCFGGANDGGGCVDVLDCPDETGFCQTNVCVGGLDAGAACTTDTDCRPIAGVCSSFCVGGTNDAAACNTSSECPGGFCTNCRAGSCNATTGACQFTALDGVTCDDGSRCTPQDTCSFGECVGGPTSDACIDLELRRSLAQASVPVGDIVRIEVWATLNGCNLAGITECAGAGMPLGAVELAFSWDPTVFELVGVSDPCDGPGCTDINCSTFPVTQYDWVTSGFLNDCALDGLNADCGPDVCCSPFTNMPFNDGNALAQFLSQPFCEPACVFGSGLQVSTLELRALRATAGVEAPTQVRLETCLANTPTRVVSFGGSVSPDVTNSVGPPVDVTVECVTAADCPPGTACQAGVCAACPPPTVKAEGARYISITPDPLATDPVALRVTGVDPDVVCVSQYVASSGLLSLTPVYQTPAAWGSVSASGTGILGSTTYEVQADCDAANPGTSLSTPVSVTTWILGDADNNNVVDILDITREIDGFRSVLLSATTCINDGECIDVGPNFECDLAAGFCTRIKLENADLIGPGACVPPDQDISILDITKTIDEFRSLPETCLGPCAF